MFTVVPDDIIRSSPLQEAVVRIHNECGGLVNADMVCALCKATVSKDDAPKHYRYWVTWEYVGPGSRLSYYSHGELTCVQCREKTPTPIMGRHPNEEGTYPLCPKCAATLERCEKCGLPSDYVFNSTCGDCEECDGEPGDTHVYKPY